jgi:hypothetical protein
MNTVFNNFTVSFEKLELKRKLSRTSRVKPCIAGYSQKMRSMQFCESKLELDAILRLEFDPSVKHYLTQPCSFYIKINGKKRRYTPDILVETVDGQFYFVEVKPKTKADDKEFITKFTQITQFFETEVHIGIQLLTDDVIRCNKLIPNLELLYAFIDVPMKPQINKRIFSEISGPMSISDIESICQKFVKSTEYVWGLIAQGFFNFSNETVIKKNDLLTLNTNKLGA